MDKGILLFIIIFVYLFRAIFLKTKKRDTKFLWVSFYIFCIPFEFGKALNTPKISDVAGTIQPIYIISLCIGLIVAVLPFARWKYIDYSFKINNWINCFCLLLIASVFNPYNVFPTGTWILAVFFLSNILLFKLLDSFLTRSAIINGLFDGLMLLAGAQFFLAICFPVLGLSIVTRLFHESAEIWATRLDTRSGAVGFFNHPGRLALFMVISASFYLSTYLYNFRKKTSLICLILCILIIFLTYSRTSYLALIITLSACYYINKNAHKNIFSLANILKFVVPTVLVLGYLIVYSPLSALFLQSDSSDQYDNRMVHWLMAFNIFNTSPYIGVGLNAHLAYISQHLGIVSQVTMDDFFSINPIHNIHLIVLSELGIVGVILWFSFLFGNLFKAKKQIKQGGNEILSLTLTGLFVAYIIYGLTGWAPFSTAILPLFLFITFFSIKYRNQ
ncbi:O-antigen ligase family protein [Pedobacter cryoconitis]|uniref:O-antigen ligase n=1 Tax=Pedobacter cryoconitis TaxID=188932 RepID=A0A7X0J561_9SPHI|nr:O-antigen ligase family protein [Pedobacter cryoconitis]MBB6500859.1 O-antigen ligase [Pedobacter cryoconitis]